MVQSKPKREVAWRLFAREFNSATVELPGEEQFSPSYLLSPLGAKINRIYIAGVLTECENIGSDQEPLWRGRVSDPTDVFYVSAGQFQPKAAQVMSELEVPALVGIVGKARTYSPDEMTTYVSVRVEMVKKITQEQREYWNLEACQSLNYRLGCMVEALQMEPPEADKLVSLGYGRNLANGVLEAITQFGKTDIQEYGQLLVNTIKELDLETSTEITILEPDLAPPRSVPAETVPEGPTETGPDLPELGPKEGTETENTSEKEAADTSNEAQEQIVFEIITSLVEENPDGVVYEDVQARAAEHGLERPVVEEHITSLIDKGIIYEPSIGVFKAV
ncbi:hypothetical protein [[Eubacterium] cellulosolvens]